MMKMMSFSFYLKKKTKLMVQSHLSAQLCIKCFVIEMVLVEMRFKSTVFIFFIGFNLCICLFFFIVVLYFSFENFKL